MFWNVKNTAFRVFSKLILTVSLSREHYFPVTENFTSHEYFNPPVSSARL